MQNELIIKLYKQIKDIKYNEDHLYKKKMKKKHIMNRKGKVISEKIIYNRKIHENV